MGNWLDGQTKILLTYTNVKGELGMISVVRGDRVTAEEDARAMVPEGCAVTDVQVDQY